MWHYLPLTGTRLQLRDANRIQKYLLDMLFTNKCLSALVYNMMENKCYASTLIGPHFSFLLVPIFRTYDLPRADFLNTIHVGGFA